MNRKRLLLGAGCLLSLITFTTIALTQDELPTRKRPVRDFEQPPTYDPNQQLTPVYRAPDGPFPTHLQDGTPVAYRVKTVPRTVYETVTVSVSAEEAKQLQAMQAAKVKLKKAPDDAARKAATDVIQQCLVKQFEQDLAQREKELAAVEERLKTLRQQLDKRKQAKDEIITLRLKTIVNNVEGLGFPSDEDPRSSSGEAGANLNPYNSATFEPVFDQPRRALLSPDEDAPTSVPRAR